MNKINTNSNPHHRQQLLSVYDAGAVLGLSPWTIRQWCYTGKIASHKIGSRLMVSYEAIDQLLRESLRPRVQESK